MRILSITAQKPHSTGSGVYLTGLVKGFAALGHEQAVVAGVYEEDEMHFPEGTRVYPVYYKTESLPFPIAGMSDEMPYTSTRYRDMTEEMAGQFKAAFLEVLDEAIEKAAKAVDIMISQGVDAAMNEYNRKVPAQK